MRISEARILLEPQSTKPKHVRRGGRLATDFLLYFPTLVRIFVYKGKGNNQGGWVSKEEAERKRRRERNREI